MRRRTGRRSAPSTALVAAVVAAAIAWPGAALAGDGDDAFRKGMVASDLGRYVDAATRFREAIAADGRESDRQILISGVFYTAYLPHYHLGRVLLAADEARCAEALAAWATSADQGVVQDFARPWADLRRSRDRCRAAVLPAALDAASAAVERAAAASQGVPDGLADGAAETERRAARAQLEGARSGLDAARRAGDPEAAAAAADLARDAERRFESLGAQLSAADAERVNASRVSSRRALADVELERRSLESRLRDPDARSARASRPQDFEEVDASIAAADLESLRRRFDGAQTATDFEAVGRDAAAVAARLRELDGRLTEALAAARAAPARETAVPPPPPPPAAAPDASPAGPPPAERSSDPDPPSPEARRLLDAGRRLLERAEDVAGAVAASTRGRLGADLRSFDSAPADAGSLGRLERSYAALQIVLGADALLDGRAAEALEILSARDLPDDAVGAHGRLLRAAALYQLARVDEEESAALLDRATRDLARYRALGGQGPPAGSLFFPSGFWRFVADAGESG
ncbi:MAG: hypothetical protein AAFX50_00995 [Acidobacteriota bacterium]